MFERLTSFDLGDVFSKSSTVYIIALLVSSFYNHVFMING